MLFQMSGLDRPYNTSEQKYLEQSRNLSVGYTNLIHLIQMRSYKSLNDIPTIHVTITITNKWNRTVDAFCVSNAILGQMINGWLKINQFRNNLKRFSLSGLHRIDIIIYLIKIGQWQSLLLRTSTRSPTCKTTQRTPVWSIECSRTILVISNVFWEVNHRKTMLKLS